MARLTLNCCLAKRIRRKDVSVWDTVLQMWRLPAEPQVVFHVGSSSRKLPLVSRQDVIFFAVQLAHGVLDRRNCLTTCTELDIAVSTWKSYRQS